MKKLFYISILLSVTIACKSDPVVDEGGIDSVVVAEYQTTTFEDTIGFKIDRHLELLDELNICEMVDSFPLVANCSADNFKIIPIQGDDELESGFILQTKAGIVLKGANKPLPPVRHIFVYIRENGSLTKVNGFRGDLIATQDGEKGKDIVLALYLKEDVTLFHCLYKWDGERYSFESVVGLDWGDGVKTLKEDTKDSVSNDIYNAIMDSKLVF